MLWNSLLDKRNDYNGHWLCIGDFNMILLQSKKYGGQPYASLSNDPFHCLLDSFGIVYLGFFGNPFTWSNKRQEHHLIKEHLDRGIANSQWVHLFSHLLCNIFPLSPLTIILFYCVSLKYWLMFMSKIERKEPS
jgi:hypothetical protein